MQIRTFEAATLERTQAAVRKALGEDALILGIEETIGGLKITAAVETEDDVGALLAPAPTKPDPALTALLAFHGLPPGLRANVANVAENASLEQSMVLALSKKMRPSALGPRHLLIGPPGHGRSLQAARIALALAKDDEQPRVLAIRDPDTPPDTRLAYWLADTGITVETASDDASVARAAAEPGPLIIDAPGLPLQTTGGAERLRTLTRLAAHVRPTLVVSAEVEARTMLELVVAGMTLGCESVLATKLDLATRYGGLATLALSSIPLLPVSVSAHPEEPLSVLRPAGLARLLIQRFNAQARAPRANGEDHR